MLVAGAIAGSVRVDNLLPMSKQADRSIIQALMWAGAKISIQENFIEVSKHELNAFHFDATHCPDLFPPLVAASALMLLSNTPVNRRIAAGLGLSSPYLVIALGYVLMGAGEFPVEIAVAWVLWVYVVGVMSAAAVERLRVPES